MATWKRKPQECGGTYRFDGKLYMTVAVPEKIPPEEIIWIVQDVRQRVTEENGIDYLQVYEDDKGRKLFFIDQLNDEMKQHHPPDHNYATLQFSWEY